MILQKEFRFEASHRLPHHEGKCRRLHGHSWRLLVEVEGPVERASGFVLDYHDIKKAVQPIVEDLDHKHLGTWKGMTFLGEYAKLILDESGVSWLPENFNATSENLLLAIAKRLGGFEWSKLTLCETCTCSATLTRAEFRSRREKHGTE